MAARFIRLLIGTLLAVALAELFLSHSSLVWNPPGQYRRSETRAFEHVPNYEGKDRFGNGISINSFGFRDKEYTLEKPSGIFRIVVLGDSVAFGDGVRAADTFSDQLETALNRELTATRVEVLNGGVRGYNTYQELLLLKEIGLKFDPDLVLLTYLMNDAQLLSDQYGIIDKKHKRFIALKEIIKKHSYLYAFLNHRLLTVKYRIRYPRRTDEPTVRLDHDNPGWVESYNALKEMKELTQKKDIGFLMAVMPRLKGLGAEEEYPDNEQEKHDKVLETGERLQIDTVDLLKTFKGHRAEALKVTGEDDLHPNAYGHRLIAETLKDHILTIYLSVRRQGV